MKKHRVSKFLFLFLFCVFTFCCISTCTAQFFLHNGHSHNDYTRKQPLFDALESGFRSVEVDVFLHKDELVVSHIHWDLDSKPTIQDLYLNPLQKIIELNGGTVFPNDSTTLILYIDFKTGEGTYEKLAEISTLYPGMFKTWNRSTDGNHVHWGPVELLIDGHEKEIRQAQTRFTSIQKGLNDYDIVFDSTLVPRLNGNYRTEFKWRGLGKMPIDQYVKLAQIAHNVHSRGRTLRLYASTNRPSVWQTLTEANSDWINVDKLEKYRKWWMKTRLTP